MTRPDVIFAHFRLNGDHEYFIEAFFFQLFSTQLFIIARYDVFFQSCTFTLPSSGSSHSVFAQM
jgi:hypothetical protein